MSVLETPRIYFKGEVAWDPIVTNNFDTNYDETTGKTIYPSVVNRVKAFREQAIEEPGNWNPHGTHRAVLYETSVSGFDMGNGVNTDDPFVSAAVDFTAMLVDLEPYGTISSQLYFDAMRFGVDGGYRISAPRTSRVTARYINFARNSANKMIAGVASVVWQTSFAKTTGLRIDAFDSPLLQTLAGSIEQDDVLGLTVRFNTYRTIYYDNPDLTNGSLGAKAAAQALITKLKRGGFQPNPARSMVVGVVGLWRKLEPAYEPGDRVLIPATDSPIGSAYARLAKTTLTLDLSNSVPEVDKNLTKKDLGVLNVVAVDSAGQVVLNLGSFGYGEYNRAAYEMSAGIVSIPLAPGIAQSAVDSDLHLRDAAGTPLLEEMAVRAIPATPNLYLDEGEDVVTTFQAYIRGRLAASRVPVTLFQLGSGGTKLAEPRHLLTDSKGVLTLSLTKISEGITAYVPSLSSVDQPVNGINPQVSTYMYVRVRPGDAAVAALAPTWENVYSKVLANWSAMAPCMDNWLKLDDPVQIKAYASVLKRLTDPAQFENFSFMPVTRDLSAGERALLYNFLDSLDEGALGKPKTQKPLGPNFVELSRAMRRGSKE